MALNLDALTNAVVNITTQEKNLGKAKVELANDEVINQEINKIGLPLLLDLNLIHEDELQPRKEMTEEGLNDLSNSIKIYGVKQPILVRKLDNGRYKIISGHRRFRASKLAGLNQIPVTIDYSEVNEKTTMILQISENIHRENLTDLEISEGLQYLLDKGVKQKDLPNLLNKSRSYISEHILLNKLPDFLKETLKTGKILSFRSVIMLAKKSENEPELVKEFLASYDNEIPRNAIEIFLGKDKQEVATHQSVATTEPIQTENVVVTEPIQTENVVVTEPIQTENVVVTEPIQTENVVVIEPIQTENVVVIEPIQTENVVVTEQVKAISIWKNPTFKVEYEGSDALILMNFRCKKNNYVKIKLDYDETEKEVEIAALQFKYILEA